MRAVQVKRIRRYVNSNYGCVYVDLVSRNPRRLYRTCGKALVKQCKRALKSGNIAWWQ